MGILETNKHQTCIDACKKCTQTCYECFHACLNEPDLNARKNCVSMLIECAIMCQMSVTMMSMNGQYSKEHCSLCYKICVSCAKECKKFKDEHCQDCAQVCNDCADECRKMAGM
jgi:hypothetical protein